MILVISDQGKVEMQLTGVAILQRQMEQKTIISCDEFVS